MKIEQSQWSQEHGWKPAFEGDFATSVQLVLLFGSRQLIQERAQFEPLQQRYPNAIFLGCSTSGEIMDVQVRDDTLVSTAIYFEHSSVHGAYLDLKEESSEQAGEQLARSLPMEGLVHAFVLSDGLHINGSDFVEGIGKHLPEHVAVTGGLSGDGADFVETYVVWNGAAHQNKVAIIGFYGERLKIGYGSLGGWDAFGPERLITRSKDNVLFEVDGQSALELYKNYLGEHAEGLPATGLLFPLSIRTKDSDQPLVRTILAVNDEDQSMTFAGDVPEGAYARFMRANFDRLVDGAAQAAQASIESLEGLQPDLAILISCVGRKLVLKQRIEEEVEAVRDLVGEKTVLTGFYSYGELAPFRQHVRCALHNQTMTITTLSEK